jgi:agmatinase
MAKTEPKSTFDPNGPAGVHSGIFGLPYSAEQADLILIPVPWDVTVSYATGAAKGPAAILEASRQVDLFLADVPQAWNNAVHMLPLPEELRKRSKKARKYAEAYIHLLTEQPEQAETERAKQMLAFVNAECASMNDWVYNQAKKIIQAGKMVALIGGDHSTPLGLLKALAEKHSFSVLHIDAHADLRIAYENFTYSHASIMYNALQFKGLKNLVQVGIRDWCQQEQDIVEQSKGRIIMFTDEYLKNRQYSGKTWSEQCDEIMANLGDKVYISFDIDGLDPKLCPNTGTPVPGGLEFYEALLLIKKVVQSGRQLIGFDVVEVAPGKDEWDANVGARLIYQLANQMFVNSKKEKPAAKKKSAKNK